MVDWGTYKNLAFTFGPIVVPFLWGQYRKLRVQLATSGRPHPPPRGAYNAITILWVALIGLVIASFPYWQPENIFTLTESRMQTPTNVMFERLKKFRPGGFTWMDETFQVRLNVPDGRALYMKYGPDAILNCYWCAPMSPLTYTTWLLPEILSLHVLNTLAIGLATSNLVGGRESSRWRYYATFAALAIAGIDIWYVHSYDWIPNMLAKTAGALDFFYWRMRTLRPLVLAALDAALAGALWLSSTGRLFVQPLTSAEKVETLTQQLLQTQQVSTRSGMLQNAILRNNALRNKTNTYWQREEQVMQEILRDEQVTRATNRALSQRINMNRLNRDATTFTEGIAPVQLTSTSG